MSEYRHGLESFLLSFKESRDHDANLNIQLQPLTETTNLRGNPADVDFLSAVSTKLGQALPLVPNTMSLGKRRIYWLGPDEWLILSEAEIVPKTFTLLKQAINGLHAAVTDVSGGQLIIRLSGPGSRDVLARGCTLDFHPEIFTEGSSAQSGLAKAGMLIGLIDKRPIFELIIRRSFADYVAKWLKHSASKNGSVFSTII